jgi:hypothetical protein
VHKGNYSNDVELSETDIDTYRLFVTRVDEFGGLLEQKIYNILSSADDKAACIAYLNGLPTGTTIMVARLGEAT